MDRSPIETADDPRLADAHLTRPPASLGTPPVSEQNARLVPEISHRSYVFEIGKIALSGESRTLSEDPRIKKAYLGA